MPKLTSRCDRRGPRFGMPVATVSFMAPPRKVSFEDGHAAHEQHTSTSSSTTTTSSSSPNTSTSALRMLSLSVPQEEEEEGPTTPGRLLSRKPTLIRPITSLSLVELAAQSSESEDEEEPNRSCSFMSLGFVPLSPLATTSADETEPRSTMMTTPPASPWGHFVELLVPSPNNNHGSNSNSRTSNTNHNNHNNPPHSHQESCNCCSSCRRQRSSPYGDYKYNNSKASKKRRPLAFLQEGSIVGGATTIQPFRLTPRLARVQDKPTDQLISGLVRMRVDC